MLNRRTLHAAVVAAFSAIASLAARAEEPPAPAQISSGIDGETTTPAATADAPTTYANIYQAPLFGSLSALAAKDAPVDEGALRYYASLHNTARVNAEIKRLKALHPNWTAPINLYSTAGAGNDEQPFWDLLAADRYDELHAAIALRIKNEPGWRPSRDLTTKIARKEAIRALTAESNVAHWTRVLDIVDEDPTVLHCAHMDSDWRIADAFLNVGMASRALEIYRAIIASCPDHEERLSTIRKSISRFSVEQVKSLIALGNKGGDGLSEFEETKVDLTRARIAAINSGKGVDDIVPQELADFVTKTEKSNDRADLALASWYMYDHERYGDAKRLFALGAPASPDIGKSPEDVKFAEGEALSLLKSGDAQGALDFAAKWRDVGAGLRQTYATATILLLTRTDPPANLSDAAVADFIRTVNSEQNFEGAIALGWHWLHAQDAKKAETWFLTALTWKGIDLAQPAPTNHIELQLIKAIEGYTQSLAQLGREREALTIADNWREADGSLLQMFLALATTVVGQAERADAVSAAQLQHFARQIAVDHNGAGAAVLGWLYYRSSDYRDAIDSFHQSVEWSANGKGDSKTNQGLAISLQRVGRLDEAEEVAWAWRSDQELRATYLAIFAMEIGTPESASTLSLERLARFVSLVRTERSSFGAQAIGWYRLSQGNCSYAAPWFRAAAKWSADPDDVKVVEGLTLSLRAIGAYDRAEDLAYAWRERSSRMRTLFLSVGVEALTREAPSPAVNEKRISRLASAALDDHDPAAARSIAWRRVRDAACEYSAIWFRRAAAWGSGQERDPSIDDGQALALRALGRLDDADELLSRWIDKNDGLRAAFVDTVVEELGRDNPPEPLDDDKLTKFTETVTQTKSAYGAQAFAWYRYERNELSEAEKWFKNALDWWPARHDDAPRALLSPKRDYIPALGKLALAHFDYTRSPLAYAYSATRYGQPRAGLMVTVQGEAATWEGYALTLRAEGRKTEAAQIAGNWRERWKPLRGLFVDLGLEEIASTSEASLADERLARYVIAIEEDRSAAGATAMAWRQYARANYKSSADWFRRALDWSAQGAGETPDPRLVEGYALALRAQKEYAEALALAGKWRNASPRLNVLYLETRLLASRDSGRKGDLSEADIAEIEKAIDENHSASGAIAVAWAAYEGGDYEHALRWFQNAVAWSPNGSPDAKALEGVTLSLRGLGRYREVGEFARRWLDEVPEVRRAYYDSMLEMQGRTDAATSNDSLSREAFERLAEDDRNPPSAEALGWAKANHGDWVSARLWFERALRWRGVDPANAEVATASLSTVKVVEGYARALRATGDLEAADDVAYLWRLRLQSVNEFYLQVATEELNDANILGNEPKVKRFAEWARDNHSAIGANRLGWLAYRRGDGNTAVDWFDKARAWTFDSEFALKNDEAFALALRAAGRTADAEAFTWPRRNTSKDLRATYIASVIDQLAKPELATSVTPARLERFASVVRVDKSAAGAEALGWKRLAEAREGYAVPWFEMALAWSTPGSDKDRNRAGLAQALNAVGRFDAAERVAYVGVSTSPELRKLYVSIVTDELTREWLRPQMPESRITRFAAIVLADKSHEGAQALGWRRYEEAGCGYGAHWLRKAMDWSKDRPADAKLEEGYALTLRAVGRLAEAEEVAWSWVNRRTEMKKLYIDIVVEELSRDNPPEPMPDDRLQRFISAITSIHSALGAQAVAWYHHGREENEPAAKWFALALEWWPQPLDETKKLSLPVDDYRPILPRLALRLEDYRRTPLAFPNSSLLIGKSTEDYVATLEGYAKTVEGYVLTLGSLKRFDDAEQLAWKWSARWPRLRAAYVDIAAAHLRALGTTAAPSETVARMIELVNAEHSPVGAEALAWRAFAASDYDAANRWFHSIVDWRKADAPADLDLMRAYVTSLSASKRYDDAMQLIANWRSRLPGLDTLFVDVALGQYATLEAASPEAARKLAEIAESSMRTKSPTGAASLGWVAFQRKDASAALAWFKQAIVWTPAGGSPAAKTLEGYARALQAAKRYQDAMTFAMQWSEPVPSLKPLFVEMATQALAYSAAENRDVDTELLANIGQAFAETKSANGAQALAWQRVAVKDWATAEAWFRAARSWRTGDDEDLKTIEGQIIALRALNRTTEAEDLAYTFGKKGGALRDIYLEIVADRLTRTPPQPPDEAGMRRYAELVVAGQSAGGAETLGWYSFNVKQYTAASAWFEKSLAWDPNENAAYGLALSYKASSRMGPFKQLLVDYKDRFGRIAELAAGRTTDRTDRRDDRRAALEVDSAPEPAPERSRPRTPVAARGDSAIGAALSAKDYSTCVQRGMERSDLDVTDRIALGWCLMNLKRPVESARAFAIAKQSATSKTRDEAAYGESLALLAAGETSSALAAASESNLDPERRRDVGGQALAQRAWNAFNAEHYAEALQWLDRRSLVVSDTRDLLRLRAMCLTKLGRNDEAQRLNAAADSQLSQD